MILYRVSGQISKVDEFKHICTQKTLKGIQSWLIEQERSAAAVGTTLDI